MNIRLSDVGRMLSEVVRQRIIELREKRGLSRPQLAALMDPPPAYQQIEKLEKGERKVTLEWIERLAPALGVYPEDLIIGAQTGLSEPVAAEVGKVLARVALRGREPDAGIVEALSLILVALSDTLARYPDARRDPSAIRPVVDLLAKQHAG